MPLQARAPDTRPFGPEAFAAADGTVLRWLGMAGFLINSRGTTLMVDPLLGGFDMPVMIEFPIAADEVPRLDAVLVTHSDADHYSVSTCRDLADVTASYHSTRYVGSLMTSDGLPGYGHDIDDTFDLGLGTGATHSRRPRLAERLPRRRRPPLRTRGLLRILARDSRRHHLGTGGLPADPRAPPQMPTPDAMLFDFSDSEWHFGLDGAVEMANAYPHTPLLLHHWGCVDAPDFPPFNADPDVTAGPGRQPRTYPPPGAGRTVRTAPAARLTRLQIRSGTISRQDFVGDDDGRHCW